MRLRQKGSQSLHLSHLVHHVSAYRTTPESVQALSEDILGAVEVARASGKSQIVDDDGEMFFVVYPKGQVSLCLRWQDFDVIREEDGAAGAGERKTEMTTETEVHTRELRIGLPPWVDTASEFGEPGEPAHSRRILDGDGDIVCQVPAGFRADENATLIKSVPDLYSALKVCLQALERISDKDFAAEEKSRAKKALERADVRTTDGFTH